MVSSNPVEPFPPNRIATTCTSVCKTPPKPASSNPEPKPTTGLFCPFAHRVNLIRHLKSLTSVLPISIVKPYPKGDDNGWPGWRFPQTDDEYPNATTDGLFGSQYLHEVYYRAEEAYQGRFTVPVLWDTKTETIVNNESAEILRFLETAFDDMLPEEARARNFYPEHLRGRIDEICEWMQRDLNLGVYRAGFAPNQEVYEKNVVPVFDALNRLEKLLAENNEKGPFVLGEEMTEVDLRLFPTLIRFDTVYVQHFKCNLGTIRHSYPRLNRWMKNLYWEVLGFKETTDFKHIKENVSCSRSSIIVGQDGEA